MLERTEHATRLRLTQPYDRAAGDSTPGADRVAEVPIHSLRCSISPRINGEDMDHVKALAESDAELPPIVVHRQTKKVIDGMHRLRAARLRGQQRIAVRFVDGCEAEAFVLAVRANVDHGLPLSLADRKRAADRIIGCYPQWSDRRIASITGLSAKTIADRRKEQLRVDGPTGRRIGQDGRARPVSSEEGRRKAGELISNDPNLSLRQVAKVAGISPETVRDVRARLARGEDPVISTDRRRSARAPKARPAAAQRTPASSHDTDDLPATAEELAAAVLRLKRDPSLRFHETGRTLLRLLDAHALVQQRFDTILDSLPEHSCSVVARAASACADFWSRVAEQTACLAECDGQGRLRA